MARNKNKHKTFFTIALVDAKKLLDKDQIREKKLSQIKKLMHKKLPKIWKRKSHRTTRKKLK